MGVLSGKRGLIMGVANEKSAAWGIAKAAADHGAELAFTYQIEGFRKDSSHLLLLLAHPFLFLVM